MADSNQLKRVDPVDLGNEDPFAELTRIMGFDPRVPVRPASEPQAAPAAARPEVAAPEPDLDLSSDDLDIDLERELLGELALEDVSAPAGISAETAVSTSVADGGELDPNLDLAIAADLYEAANSVSAGVSFDEEPLLSDIDFDAAFERELAGGQNGSHWAVANEESDLQDGLSVEDAALLAALDPARDFHEPVTPQAESAHPYSAGNLDPDFDLAMAEVDMDFSLDSEGATNPVGAAEQSENAYQLHVAGAQPSEPDVYQGGTIDFDDLDEAPVMEAEPASELTDVDPERSEDYEPQAFDNAEPQGAAYVEPQASGYVERQAVEYFEQPSSEYVEPKGSGDYAPQASDNAEPQGAAYVEPQASDYVEPQAAEYFEQPSSEFVEPEGSEDYAPQASDNAEPQGAAYVEQQATEYLEPQATDYFEQQSSEYAEPEGSEDYAPQASDNPEPQGAGYVELQAPEYVEPQATEYFEQQSSDYVEPESSEDYEPQASEYVEPQAAEYFEQQGSPAEELVAEVAEPVSVVTPEAEQAELSLEDELNALLGNTVPRAKLTGGYDAPPLTAALAEPASSTGVNEDYRSDPTGWSSQVAATSYPEDVSDDYAGPSYQVAEVEHAQQPSNSGYAADDQSDTDDLEFDDHDFHAAFENSLLAEEPEVSTGRYHELPYSGAGQLAADRPYTASTYADASFASAPAWHASAPSDEDVPDIETVDVPEGAIAVTDDLDIPEVAYEEEVRPAPVFDEFESEFAAVYAEPQQSEAAAAYVEEGRGQPAAETDAPVESPGYDYAAGVAAGALVAGAAYGAAAQASAHRDYESAQGFHADELAGSRQASGRDADPFDAIDYSDTDEEVALPPYVEQRRAPQRRGLMIAAIVGGVVVLGGVGAFALSFGGGGSDIPAIVKADDSPIKVRPENPGGTTVPNQDNKVYQTVVGAGDAAAPAQQKLISSAEEPVDMAAKAPEPEALPSGIDDVEALDGEDEIAAITAKAEDRIQPSPATEQPGTDNTEVAAVTPRRVRTMVVRPDGTLVPRENPAPVAAAEPQVAAEAMMDTVPADTSATPKAAAASPAGTRTANANPATPAPTSALKSANVPAAAGSGTPATVPVAPSRPADQPVNVVGEVKPEQVAAISTNAPAAGAWSMQIASQPSEDAAKSTFQDLARRYASVLGGRDATIVKAEIAGKGTFWRVRVPAGSRSEAISLCESYKAAGGSCFVSK
jgi:hypothetical protein